MGESVSAMGCDMDEGDMDERDIGESGCGWRASYGGEGGASTGAAIDWDVTSAAVDRDASLCAPPS